ncbi:MAG TPA: restriction endonuclease subunit S [Nevskiales bacterium]|nr:restriction endonuclease subunit S [Nevskiales bacterium]
MAGEWIHCAVADACSSIDYGLTASAAESEVGPKFLRITDIVTGHIDWNTVPHVSADDATVAKYRLHDGDVVLARTGASTGASAYVKNPPPAVFASYLVRLQAKPEFDARYLAYYLQSDDFRTYIRGVLGDKSAQPNASASTMTKAPFRAPKDKNEQRAIAHILGTLDDKIELNRKQNETLEAMARALFKAWFVDFEPVRAKMEGRWQRGQSLPGLPAHLYDLFPDRLVESELGEIPEGWKVVRAGQIYDVGIGKTPPRKESEWFSEDPEDVPWMSIKDLGRAGLFISEVSEYLTPAAVERFRIRRIPDGTVVLSFKLTVGRVAITDGEMLSNEAIAHFLPRAGNHICPAYLYCYLRQFDYESLGSTSSIATAVNSDSVRSIPILAPGEPIGKVFESLVANSFTQIRAIQRESHTLAQLRDTLLPKLISGELRVKDAEAFLKERGL